MRYLVSASYFMLAQVDLDFPLVDVGLMLLLLGQMAREVCREEVVQALVE